MSKKSGPVPTHTCPGSPENLKHIIPKSRTMMAETSNSRRRHITAAALIPLSSGKTPPSKWDDAERWITSPMSGQAGSSRRTPLAQVQPQKQIKSKSGPLLGPGFVYSSSSSPSTSKVESGNVRSVVEEAPLGALFGHDGVGRRESDSLRDVWNGNSMPNPQGKKLMGATEDKPDVSKAIHRKYDVATQIDQEGNMSTQSSSRGNSSFSTTIASSIPAILDNDAKDEIRDVQIDKGTTTTVEQSNAQKQRITTENEKVNSPWNAPKASKNASRLQVEEAKITAWENLQKAKAEEAIQKLEIKLEKKRLGSMEKIMSKLRAAQIKAESMRNSLSENDHLEKQHLVLRKGMFSCSDVGKSSVFNCFAYTSKY